MTETAEIHILDQKVRLLQPEKGFCAGLDSVMLGAACPVQKGDSVLDMGCGVGGAAFCVLHRVPEAKMTGVDVQQDYINLAKQNAKLNGCNKTVFIHKDIRDFEPEDHFDHVICNPPYLETGAHLRSPEKSLAVARGHDDELSVQDWVDAGFYNVKSGGSLSMIHRADMIDKIIRALGKRFGAVEVIPLWPRAGEQAKRVIIRAIKDRKTPAILHAGLVLHEADGEYTKQANLILRSGAAL